MVKIRLKRTGKNKFPSYRLVIADARAPRDGKFIAEVGHFNPISKELKLNKVEILSWLEKGAQPTETVRTLLKKENIMAEFAQSKITKRVELEKVKATKNVEKPIKKARPVSKVKLAKKTIKKETKAKAKTAPKKVAVEDKK